MIKVKSKRRSKHAHKMGLISLLLILILVGYFVFIALSPVKAINPTIEYKYNIPSNKLVVIWPSSKQAAIGVQGYGLIASNGQQIQTPTASIAKLVTALAVLSKYPLSLGEQGPTLTLTATDVSDFQKYVGLDGSVVAVVAGEKISEYQALEAMLLPSANNMADSLAIWAFGSIDNYINYANQFTASMGLSSTHISDASGFSPATVSTANDLILLGESALNNNVIAQIVDLPNANLPVAGVVNNVDWFINKYNLVGIKTGNTDQAGGCFLSAAKFQTPTGYITVIGAVMNAPTLQVALDQTIPMLQSVKSQIQNQTIPANTVIGSYAVPWQNKVQAVTTVPIQVTYIPGMNLNYTQKLNNQRVPLNQGKTVGASRLYIQGSNTSSSSLIISNNDILKPSFKWKLLHPSYSI